MAAEKAAAGCTQRGDESISRTIGQGAAAAASVAAGWGQEMGERRRRRCADKAADY